MEIKGLVDNRVWDLVEEIKVLRMEDMALTKAYELQSISIFKAIDKLEKLMYNGKKYEDWFKPLSFTT